MSEDAEGIKQAKPDAPADIEIRNECAAFMFCICVIHVLKLV